jgi:hypothetical protein
MQRIKLIDVAMVVAALAVSGAACAADRPSESKSKSTPPSSAQPAPKAVAQTVVYYFHGTNRCHTCRTIEAYADESVKAAFAAELSSGAIQWKPTNTDESANEHFIKDYQLYTRSLVVVDGSNPKRFKTLDKVWQLVGDKTAFLKYVQDEVRAFRKS